MRLSLDNKRLLTYLLTYLLTFLLKIAIGLLRFALCALHGNNPTTPSAKTLKCELYVLQQQTESSQVNVNDGRRHICASMPASSYTRITKSKIDFNTH